MFFCIPKISNDHRSNSKSLFPIQNGRKRGFNEQLQNYANKKAVYFNNFSN